MSKLLLSLIVPALALAAASSSIGIIKSNGQFCVDGSTISGNSTIFEGSVIETTATRLVAQVTGAQFTLLPNSRAKMYQGRTVLQKGSGFLRGGQTHILEAATLRIAPSLRNSVVQVEVTAPGHIAVSARQGGAEVRNSSGVLIAALRPGMGLAFGPQAAARMAVTMKGTLESVAGKYFLTDKTTNVRVELQGNYLAKYVGRQVEITGSIIPGASPTAGASQVVNVVTIKAATAGGAVTPGRSASAKPAIIGGVVVGGVVVGLASAGVFGGASSASRP